VTFGVTFGLFVVMIVVIAVLALRWAVRRDRAVRERMHEVERDT
jgi:hypothetical protein